MLELIFRGFLEWIYVLLVEMWGFIADGLLDIMSLDFAYLQTHVPIIGQMEQLLLAVGWALLLGNLVFQALKSMAAGLGFEGENPRRSGMSSWPCSPSARRWPLPWAAAKIPRLFSPAGAGCSAPCVC